MAEETVKCCIDGCDGRMKKVRESKEVDGRLIAQNTYICNKCGFVMKGGISSTGFESC